MSTMHRFRSPSRSNTSVSVKKETISAPIPIPDDDEFPIRTPGASIATPVGDDADSRRISFQEPGSPRRSLVEVILDELPARQRISSPLAQNLEDPPQIQQNLNQSQRKSTSSVRSRTSTVKPERKKSTLKSVLGKLFGRKRKGSGTTASKRESIKSSAQQHRSDPTALNRPSHPHKLASQRSASLPINEFNRALRSHSVVVEDFPLRTSNQSNDESSRPGQAITRPRGATTPSHSYNLIKTPLYGDWTGLSPRPVSSHARGSQTVSAADAGEVGVAITSDSRPNRRSRSLGELRGVIPQDYTKRRRSDEIKYWRQSHEPGVLSPNSSFKRDDEPVVDEIETSSNKENVMPPEPFNFEPHMTEMAGMKITQAVSLESRVSQLEQRMLDFERFVPRTQQQSSARPMTATSEASLPKHIHRASPQRPIRASQSRDNRSFSFVSSQPDLVGNQVSNQASFESHVLPVDHPLGTFHHNAPRPFSTSTTIRAEQQGSSPITKEGILTAEHYTRLVGMISTEQAARRDLEDLVHNLQQDLYTLRASLPLNGYDHQSSYSRSEAQSDYVPEESQAFGAGDEEVFKTPMETAGDYGEGIFGEVSGNRGSGFERKKTLSLGQITQNGTHKPVSTNF